MAIVEQCPFGVTLHFVDRGVDTGDIICQKEIPYNWTDNGKTLYFKAIKKEITKLFKDNYPKFRKFIFKRKSQKESHGSFHKAIEIEEASKIELDSKYTARELLNLLRARTFHGHPDATSLKIIKNTK